MSDCPKNSMPQFDMIVAIKKEDPTTPDATFLMNELSDALELITGSSGRNSFSLDDVCGSRALFVIARRQDGEAVGCGALRPIGTNIAEVKRMYAKNKAKGIGSQILSYLEKQAEKLGYSALWLETRLINQQAVSFYEKNGYYRIPNFGKYIDKPEAVCFEKRLVNV